MKDGSRRDFLTQMGLVGGGAVIFAACSTASQPTTAQNSSGNEQEPDKKEEHDEKEVTAAEDLMREHGILRRALIVYGVASQALRKNSANVPPTALVNTAKLFRSFGEDYHEKQLEEAFIFPALKKKGGGPGNLTDVLITQHGRGREITEYVIGVANSGKIGSNAGELANALDAFVKMYETHAAREDTIIFPAWKKAISDDEYRSLSDKFEDIETSFFGKDGFEDALKQIADIESSLKLTDISQFTAPSPPAIK